MVSEKVTYKGYKDADRSDALEILHPDDFIHVPLFGLERQQKAFERAISPFSKPNLSPQILRILPRGAILYGPPGTGKTTMVKNIAKKFHTPLIIMRADKILNLYLGESEKRIAEVFKVVSDFKKCIIFIDDGETLFPRRDIQNSHHTFRTMEQVLFSEIDNLNPTKTQIIIATNKIEMLDPALISRVSLTLDFEKPMLESIISILNEYLKDINHDEEVNFSRDIIAEKLIGKDGREITSILGSAICNSFVSNSDFLKLDDLLVALQERDIISIGDSKLISERVSLKIGSSNIKSSLDNTHSFIADTEKGKQYLIDMQKKWNKHREISTFLSGKYSKILLKIDRFEGFDGTLQDLMNELKDLTNETYSYSTFRTNMRKYRDMGLIYYPPLKINDSLSYIKSYINSISNNERESLKIASKFLEEIDNDSDKNKVASEQKNYPYKKEKNKDLFSIASDKNKVASEQKKSLKIKDKYKQKSINIKESLNYSDKLNFILKLHKESQKELTKKQGPNSIFYGKLYSHILSSLNKLEGKNKKEFSKYLKDKYNTKNPKSYETYLPHLRRLNIIKEIDKKIYLDEKGKILVEYFDEYGVNNVLKWVYK